MFLDQRGGWLEQVRYVLQGAAYPLQLAVNSPSAAWRWVSESLRDARCRCGPRTQQLRTASARARDADAALRGAGPRERAAAWPARRRCRPLREKWLVAEVVNVEPNSLRQSVLLNRGTRNGVFKAQAVLDDARAARARPRTWGPGAPKSS